ncbi:ABC transporter permease [Humisphaera borealis]|uniref:ABC transporter permease subunit n=1 Tax=Humisphaera borealis TaxID=2807512 RepID=A0A7M2WPL5_9BACT|nr:ABC transporter permease subunit [Humisphaera borealis]QOV87349.1 ABC transporter permease subunit [Humisphaera borealis]
MLGIHHYLWRLIPANPILLRVVDSGGKRRRDLFIRCAYLGLLVAFVVISLVSASGTGGSGSLSSLAKTSASLFQSMSYLQLGLVALLAPVFTAGAITQEKDSQTYDILLATPLTNGQIVLGSLLSRLFFIIALLVSGIPVFSITQIFGGVAIKSIVLSFLLAAGTAFATGALAMAIATFKVGTRRTIFSFYLFIVVYMAGGIVLDTFPQFQVRGRTVTQGIESHISYFTAFNPFLALRVIFKDPTYAPPNFEDLPAAQQSWPVGYMLSNPTGFYISFMFLFSFVLVLPSIALLRRMAQSSTNLRSQILQKLKLSKGDRNRKPRTVWTNPIAWREARTKASAARATVLRYSFILIGLGAAVYLVIAYANTSAPVNAIVRGSYDERLEQITLPALDGKGSPKTLNVIPGGTKVVLPTDNPDDEPEEVDLRRMQGTMEVVSYTTFAEAPPTQNSFVKGQMGRRDPSRFLNTLVVRPPARGLDAGLARKYLLGLCAVEFAVILLIVTNAAASTVTREKEDGTLDLLLSSPITSRYYIWGKLRGLVSFVMPLVAVPVVSAGLFVVYDIFQQITGTSGELFQWLVFPEAVLLLPGMLIIICAFAAILGMQMSLRCRTTVAAVMSSVGIVVGICAGMGWCGYSFLDSSQNQMALIVGSFSPFTLMQMLIDPYASGRNYRGISASALWTARSIVTVTTLVAVGIYVAIVWQMYTGMVKGFDMTIRKQSR